MFPTAIVEFHLKGKTMTTPSDFNTGVGRRRFAQSQTKVLSVPNEISSSSFDEEDPIDYQSLKTQRQLTKESQKQLEPEERSRIETLLGLKRKTKDISIEGLTYRLQTLKNKEIKEILKMVAQTKATSQAEILHEVKDHTLALAITHIDGQKMMDILNSEALEDRLDLIGELDDKIVDKLWNELAILRRLSEPENSEQAVESIKK